VPWTLAWYGGFESEEPIEPPWQAIKEWIPDDEPDLDWFNLHQTPTQMASIKARHGKHLKSTWMTAAFRFSNTPDAAHRSKNNRYQKTSCQSGLESYVRNQ